MATCPINTIWDLLLQFVKRENKLLAYWYVVALNVVVFYGSATETIGIRNDRLPNRLCPIDD